MKTSTISHNSSKVLMLLTFVILLVSACDKKNETKSDPNDNPGAIQGAPGNPRFNLQFTNGNKTDLDLYVQTPNGSIISYASPSGQNGQLDIDCLCGICPNGPNENIYWTPGIASKGNYKVWVEYYSDCDGSGASSNFTLRIMNNSNILQTYTGTLTPTAYKSPVYNFNFQ